MKGMFIVLEGPDGSGKSTAAARIGSYFKDLGKTVVFTREPGGTSISEKIRHLILDTENTEMSYRTEALLYAAARAQLVEENIIPWLKAGYIVISERYVYSSYVYQGIGRGLGIEEIKKINDFATAGVLPDAAIFFDINPEKALNRKLSLGKGDRLEQEKLSFHQSVYEGYKTLMNVYPEIEVIDADRDADTVYEEVKKIIDSVWKRRNLL